MNFVKTFTSWLLPRSTSRGGMSLGASGNRHSALRSWVGHNLNINGDMVVDKFGLRIDGRIVGNVTSHDGLVMVGAGGSVLGTIRAQRIIVSGTVVGNLIASEVIECNASAQVQGHISSAGFMIHAGAIVRGTMSAPEAKLPVGLPQTPANDEHGQQQRVHLGR
jgi:cytoskeletal protein CcmA (bactofilin family)